MKNFIKNWDCKKHIIVESMFYTSALIIGNAFFKKPEEDKESCCPVKAYKNMPKKQKCFNHLTLCCFAVDMVTGLALLRVLKKVVK